MTAFDDLQEFQKLPRLAGLALSVDGARLVTSVSTPDPAGTRFRSALWEIDPAGERPARQLTRGPSASAPAFTPGGDLLFTAARPDPDAEKPDDDAPAALWRLPAAGEAYVAGSRAGAISGPVVAREEGSVLVSAMTLPGAVTDEDDAARRTARTEKKIGAILHAGHPVRFWDHDVGPDEPRLLAAPQAPMLAPQAPLGAPMLAPQAPLGAPMLAPQAPLGGTGEPLTFTDLTPAPGRSLGGFDVTPDGTTAVAAWRVPLPRGEGRWTVVAIDVATGERRVLIDEAGADHHDPRVSRDGRHVACLRETWTTQHEPPVVGLVVVPLGGGDPVPVAPGWDRWPSGHEWSVDGDALLVVADDGGRAPVFRLGLDGSVTRLTGDDGAYSDLQVGPDAVYALRSAVDAPPAPVRLDPAAAGQQPVSLPGPAPAPDLPGRLTEVSITAGDGAQVRAWLVLPESDSPAPLLLWVHGGPLGSWNAWAWRWNPWLMAARGWAVLLPDPALSTGYGRDFVARGWGAWGAAPYTDLMDLTDAVTHHPAIDPSRTAVMGGSFGGYMANWIAGHTDRFRAVVTHASLWSLPGFARTTDGPEYWQREMTAAMTLANSPDAHADAITTPMLVIHGDKDYRVPVVEALALWWDLLARHDGDPADVPHRFLYFPDENHWILTPQHAALWYETVFAFLDHHVLGEDWVTPDLLR